MKWRILMTLAAVFGVLSQVPACAAEAAFVIPSPETDNPKAPGPMQKAVLSGGCFWGVQGVFEHLSGVKRVLSGYSGGEKRTAQYEGVSNGNTGRAESVEITCDPSEVTYGQILQVFFSVAHDPTQLNRQGPDTGTQYRSAIFYANEEQKKIAQAYIAQLEAAKVYPSKIVTKVDPLRGFFKAEDYHQDYLVNHPDQPYIAFNDIPKVRNFARVFPALYVAKPVLVADAARNGAMNAAPKADAGSSMMMSAKPAEGGAMTSNAPGGAMTSNAPGGAMMSNKAGEGAPVIEGDMPELKGATTWLNSKPLTKAALKGKVVVIDFWTYSCINCLRALPYINACYEHYKDSGLVVIGVHSPEFDCEKDSANVRVAIDKFGIKYPVAMDSDMALWNAFHNQFWPAHYFIDANGKIRGHHFGEGKYARSERTIRQLLTEAGAKNLPDPLDHAAGTGISAASDAANVSSPETYLGFARAENFLSPGAFARDAAKDYA